MDDSGNHPSAGSLKGASSSLTCVFSLMRIVKLRAAPLALALVVMFIVVMFVIRNFTAGALKT